MRHLVLDSNIISALMRNDPVVTHRLEAELAQRNPLILCPVVLYEIERGLLAMPDATRRRMAFEKLKPVLTYLEMDQRVWLRGAQMWAMERTAGRTRGEDDLLIAAFATVHQATLATRNTSDFQGLGVPLEDWSHPS